MAVNLSALAPVTTAATALSNLVLVSPQATVGYQPQNPTDAGLLSTAQQPPAFLFNYEGEQTVTVESDITDHFVETNSAIQDQIALKPEIITTHGFIGELNNVVPFGLQTLKKAAEKLTAIGSYAPQLSVTAQLAYNEAFLLYQVGTNAVNAAVSAWSSVGNLDSNGQSVIGSNGLETSFEIANTQNKQQTAFQQLYGYWRSRTLFTVQTPWAVFQNMAIRSLRAIQDAETRVITDFEISFKMIRYASTIATAGTPTSLSGRASTQASGTTNLGASTPKPSIPLAGGITSITGVA